MARNRAQDYARGAAAGAPVAPPVADRLHLLCHLRAVLTHSPWVSGSSETTTSGQGATRREHEEKHTLVCKPLRYRVYYATAGFDTGAAAHPYEALSQLQCSWAVMPPPMTTTRGAGLAVVIWLPAAVHAIGGPSRWRWSPLVDACQCLTHEHGLVAVGETIRDSKRLDPVSIRHHFDGAGPVGAPQTAIEPKASKMRPSGSHKSL